MELPIWERPAILSGIVARMRIEGLDVCAVVGSSIDMTVIWVGK